VAFLVGILASGVVADWLVRRGVGLLTVMCGFLAIYMTSLVLIVLNVTSFLAPIWFVFGMSGQVAVLAYPWLASYFGHALSGRANTAMNLLIFGMAFGIQYAVGAVIDLFPVGADGSYDPQGYQTSFGIVLGAQVLAAIWFLTKVPKLPPD
jgi:MFS family permease